MNQHEHTVKQQKVKHKAKLVSSTLAQFRHSLAQIYAQLMHRLCTLLRAVAHSEFRNSHLRHAIVNQRQWL